MRFPASLLFGCLLLLIVNSAWAQDARQAEPIDTRFLLDNAETRGFTLGRPKNYQLTPDGQAILFLRSPARSPEQSLYLFDVATAQTRELLTAEQILRGAKESLSPEEKARRERQRITVSGITFFQLSHDGSQVLVGVSGKLYLLNRADNKVRQLPTGDSPALDPKFSPDGRHIAFARDHDVQVLDLATDQLSSLTTGGTNRLSHGEAEFVAQEEMDRFTGYWWSPDSRLIAFEEADASQVETWYVSDPAHPEQSAHPSFYPRPGMANVKVRLGLKPLAGGQTVWVNWDANRYPYLAFVRWEESGPLVLAVQTRDQKELLLLKADPTTGATTSLLTERDEAWVNLPANVPQWLENGSGFLWVSERGGGPQLELRNPDGSPSRVLVSPAAGYRGIVDVDAASAQVTYLASPDPTQIHLWRVPLAGGQPVPLTTALGQYQAVFAKNHSVYVLGESTPTTMPKATVRRADGSLVGELPSVAENPPFIPTTELLTVGRDPSFYACIVRPRDFDSAKRYPVIVDVYGGPHATVVAATLRSGLTRQWMADQGFIVVALDNRGTPGRGRDWERAISKRLGTVPLEDQVAGLKALGQHCPQMDLDRVGITGWSFGGYFSALAVLRRPDIYKAAVAGAPVVDWLDYDTHYTERYLGLPDTDAAAYREASLLTYAPALQRPLLLVHGTADDNVYFRHTLRLADALFRAGKDFDLLPLSGFTHLTPDPLITQRLGSRTIQYFRRHLGRPLSPIH
ncbi:MAG TPA: DPP IV N-terminal domain-containing protein [Tepidisphaeraceae bacterium]|nr:DPP IV N-terminal domain-containing protein [Tepidisphaeraceae bacterium]